MQVPWTQGPVWLADCTARTLGCCTLSDATPTTAPPPSGGWWGGGGGPSGGARDGPGTPAGVGGGQRVTGVSEWAFAGAGGESCIAAAPATRGTTATARRARANLRV